MAYPLVAVAVMEGTYGPECAAIRAYPRTHKFAGRFKIEGGGYAGRVAYASIDRIERMLWKDVRFSGGLIYADDIDGGANAAPDAIKAAVAAAMA